MRKYARTTKIAESNLYFIFEFAIVALTTFAGTLLGHSYIYQCVIGVVYALFYVIICLQADNELHLFVEKCAFIQKKSRKHKFNLLFMVIGCFTLLLVFYSLDLYEENTPPLLWYTNSKKKCIDQMPSF
jgi:predicted nucleic acid-binding Zn ribbon protein